MEDKIILINTLKSLSKDLQVERFNLLKIRKGKNSINKMEEASKKRINEIKQRINFNLRQHGKLLKE